jgi:hypothetical protein
MSREQYIPRNDATGNGSVDSYEFDFKITSKDQLLVKVWNAAGVLQFAVRGSDTTDLDSVTFNATEGGEVVLPAVLDSGYKIAMILAPDEPDQVYNFTDHGSFSLPTITAALDKIMGYVQRAFYFGSRALRWGDELTEAEVADLDGQLPNPADHAGEFPIINDDEDGFEWSGVTTDQIFEAVDDSEAAQVAAEAAQSAAEAAQAAASASASAAASSATDAQTAQTAAEAAQDAAEAAAADAVAAAEDLLTTTFAVTDGQAASNLLDETLNSADFIAGIYTYVIVRGTTVFSSGSFALHWRNSRWYLVLWGDNRDDGSAAHGVTFSIQNDLNAIAQLQAALDVGAGNGTIKLKKQRFAA